MIDAKTIEELRGLLAKATPGPWEADNENNDGCYGLGDDCHEGFQSASIHAPDGRGGYIKLFDALNSDVACIEEEWDEDQHYAWDEVSRANAALIVAMRNALPALLDLASKTLSSRVERAEQLAYTGAISLASIDEGATRPETWKERAENRQAVFLLAKRRAEAAESEAAALRERVGILEKALEPFAKAASDYERQGEFFSDNVELVLRVSVFAAPEYHNSTAVQVGDLRRARSALEGRDNG